MRFFSTCFLFLSTSVFAAPLQIQVPSDYILKKGETPVDIGAVVFAQVARLIDEEVKLDFISASHQREWRELKNNPYACLYNKVKTEAREKEALFSHYPLIAFPSIRLITRKGLPIPERVSIANLVANNDLKLGVIKGRSYGEAVDSSINLHPERFIHAEGANAGVLQREMVARGELDGMFEYSHVWQGHFIARSELTNVDFHTLSELPDLTFGYIACSRSTQGKMAIANFDRVMSKPDFFDYMISMHKAAFPLVEFTRLKAQLERAYTLSQTEPTISSPH
jgi:uncharacterized protein (TIGR02285 family)